MSTPEVIEAAAIAIYVGTASDDSGPFEAFTERKKDHYRAKARHVLEVAAPIIAAQAKAEALAEVAEWEAEAAASYACAANLRAPVARNARTRLDQQEADRYEHHATIALNLAARMRETLHATIEGKDS